MANEVRVRRKDRKQIIYDSSDLTVVHAEHGTDIVFVTFNEIAHTAAGTRFWRARLFDRLAISAIGFVSARPSWFPNNDDMTPAIDAALAQIRGRRVITYGASQGGYGALKFGGRLSASLALAFSPQWSINPEDAGRHDRRFVSHYVKAQRNGERIQQDDLCPRNLVVVDMAQPQDRWNADRLLALNRVSLVHCPFSGHGTIRVLTEGGMGAELIKRCAESGGLDPRALRGLIRQARRGSATYRDCMISRLIDSGVRHRGYLATALSALPDGAEKTLITITMYIGQGDKKRALSELRSISDKELLATDFDTCWRLFRKSGFAEGEARLAPLYKHRYPDDIAVRLHGVDSMIRTGSPVAAVNELQAVEAIGGADRLASQICNFYRLAGRVDLARAFVRRICRESAPPTPDIISLFFATLKWETEAGIKKDFSADLLHLQQLCAGDSEREVELLGLAIDLNMFEFARTLLDQLPQHTTDTPIVTVYRARLDATRHGARARRIIESLLGNHDGDFAFWMKLTQIVEPIAGPRAALKAAELAIAKSASPAQATAAHHRLAQIAADCGDEQTANRELAALLDSAGNDVRLLQSLAALAKRAKNLVLAAQFAERWRACDGKHAAAHFLLCYYLMEAGDTARAGMEMEAMLGLLSSGQIRFSPDQFANMGKMASEIDFGLSQRFAQLAAATYPDNDPLAAAVTRDPLFEQFYGGEAPAAPAKQGILARLGLTR